MAITRVIVNLTDQSTTALDEACNMVSDTQTDTINRATQLYAHLLRVWANGGTVYEQLSPELPVERLELS